MTGRKSESGKNLIGMDYSQLTQEVYEDNDRESWMVRSSASYTHKTSTAFIN
jgi:hypothetical protein